MSLHRGWYRPRGLPHLDAAIIQSVTFRTADSIPRALIERICAEVKRLPLSEQFKSQMTQIEGHLDRQIGECRLQEPAAAYALQEILLDGNGIHDQLYAWVIMPTHVHVLFRPTTATLAKIMKRWKGASARAINELGNRAGTFWAKDYFDRGIRDQQHFDRVFEYIENNPVKAGLCKRSEDWPHSSAGTGLGRCGIVDQI